MRSTTIASQSDSGILLEAGTNEVEILVFHVGGQICGVNVAKVREARMVEDITHLPQSPDSMDGVVKIRDRVVPAVDLQKCLWGKPCSESADQRQLLLEFNNRMIAFRVQSIDRVYRLSWKEVIPLPRCSVEPVPVTGVVLLEGKIVLILDFEWIGAQLGIAGTMSVEGEITATSPAASRCPLVYVDDSQLVRRLLRTALIDAGYTNIKGCIDGQEAWEYLEQIASKTSAENLLDYVAGVVSDIEMPRMDGFSLTRQIREHPVLKDLPVILFSSLISQDNEKKGKQVGATAQVSKPRWDELRKALEDTLGKIVRPADRPAAGLGSTGS